MFSLLQTEAAKQIYTFYINFEILSKTVQDPVSADPNSQLYLLGSVWSIKGPVLGLVPTPSCTFNIIHVEQTLNKANIWQIQESHSEPG